MKLVKMIKFMILVIILFLISHIKQYEILTSKEAYNKILNGEFKIYDEFAKNLDKIEIIDFKLIYSLDTKGFYQPIYNFDVNLDEKKSQIHIPAIKDK